MCRTSAIVAVVTSWVSVVMRGQLGFHYHLFDLTWCSQRSLNTACWVKDQNHLWLCFIGFPVDMARVRWGWLLEDQRRAQSQVGAPGPMPPLCHQAPQNKPFPLPEPIPHTKWAQRRHSRGVTKHRETFVLLLNNTRHSSYSKLTSTQRQEAVNYPGATVGRAQICSVEASSCLSWDFSFSWI